MLAGAACVACASGPVLEPSQVKIVQNAPALACITLGVMDTTVEGGAALSEPEARAAALQALRVQAIEQGAETIVFDGYRVRGADLYARARGFDCSMPP